MKRGYTLIEDEFNQNFDKKISIQFIRQTLIKKNLKKKEVSDSVTLEEKSNHTESVLNLFILFHQIVIVLSGFKAGVLSFTKVVDQQRNYDFQKFISFL